MIDNRTFIVLDGPDFSGKSTLMEAFLKRLDTQAVEYVAIREPGCQVGKPSLAEEVRQVLIAKRDEVVHPETDILLHTGYRIQNVKNVIVPALAAGKWVISDRFFFSTFCLNVHPHLDTHPHLQDLMFGLMPYVLKDIPEPITFILDTPRSIRDERAAANESKKDRYESQSAQVHDRIEAAYMQLKSSPSCKFIDGTLTLDEQVQVMFDYIEAFKASIEKSLEAEAERQEVIDDHQAKPEAVANAIKAEMDSDTEWDLEVEAEAYAQTYVVDIADRLFEGASKEELPKLVEDGRKFAVNMVKELFRRTGEDRTIFHPSRVGQVNQKVHSMLNWGFARDSWTKHFEKNIVSAE